MIKQYNNINYNLKEYELISILIYSIIFIIITILIINRPSSIGMDIFEILNNKFLIN